MAAISSAMTSSYRSFLAVLSTLQQPSSNFSAFSNPWTRISFAFSNIAFAIFMCSDALSVSTLVKRQYDSYCLAIPIYRARQIDLVICRTRLVGAVAPNWAIGRIGLLLTLID